MKLSVIIPTCDRDEVFRKTLASAVTAIQEVDAEIIVINDSRKSTPVIPNEYKRVSLHANEGRGVAAARNHGARLAQGDLLLFIDDDILISHETVRHTMGVHSLEPGIALNPDWTYPSDLVRQLEHSAFGRFLQAHQMTAFKGWYQDPGWKEQSLFESKSVASFHLSLSREDFLKTGGYDTKFPFAGFEDHDFPIRLKKAGIGFWIDTRICVFHNEADRLQLKVWLKSQERRAFTRAVAVQQGYKQLALHYAPAKKIALSFLAWLSNFLGDSIPVPNWRAADPVAFAWIGYLQAAKIYRGYSSGLK